MANFSADVVIMQDVIMKVSDKINRDFVELENLQNSQKSCEQFSEKLIEYIKEKLSELLKLKRPQNDIVFLNDRGELDGLCNSDSRYVISPICGLINLIHAIPYFCTSIALQKKNKESNKYETICEIVDNSVLNETYIAEDGKGAYVNSRRIRVSNRSKIDDAVVCLTNNDDKDFVCKYVKKYKNLVITNCEILNICNTANGKFDISIIKNLNNSIENIGALIVKESGGLIKIADSSEIIISNEQLNS